MPVKFDWIYPRHCARCGFRCRRSNVTSVRKRLFTPSVPFGASGVIEVGTGVHSGRSGPESKTAGCIRTCTDAMRVINKVAKSDPVHTVTVENNGPNVRQWQQQLETAKAAETAAARKRKRDGAQ